MTDIGHTNKQINKLTGHKLKQTTIRQRHEILIEILNS